MSLVRGDGALQTQVLEDLEGAANWRRWLCDLALPYLGDDPLEVGSGTGYYGEELAHHLPSLTVSEADPRRLVTLRERFADHDRVRVRPLHVPISERGEHSAVVSFNVLEHIPDDTAALASFAGLVRPGGAVVVLTPAGPFAMSPFDREIGHVRRYSRRSLVAAATAAGLTVEEVRHINAPGLIAWIVAMRLLRRRPGASVAQRVWDARIIPLIRRVEAHVRVPFGQTLLLVARVPHDG